MITAIVNGLHKTFPEPLPLSELLQKSCPPRQRIIAELNGQIIKSADWASTIVKNGDRLELVTIVGGG